MTKTNTHIHAHTQTYTIRVMRMSDKKINEMYTDVYRIKITKEEQIEWEREKQT